MRSFMMRISVRSSLIACINSFAVTSPDKGMAITSCLWLSINKRRQRLRNERMRGYGHALLLAEPRYRARQAIQLDRLAGQQIVRHRGHHLLRQTIDQSHDLA